MKFADARPYADPETAARKLMELANAVEAVQDGRIHVEQLNGPMLFEHKATPAEYSAGLKKTAGPGSLIVSSILGDSGPLGRSPASAQQSTWLRHAR
jgi:hypothetical protein